MQRVNGKMTHTERDCNGVSRGFAFSRLNYHFDLFYHVDGSLTAENIWPIVDTIEEVIESFDKLITKRKLKTDEPNTKRRSRKVS